MSRLSVWWGSFFSKDNVSAFLNLALKIMKMIIGRVANDLNRIAQEEVARAEASGKSGTEKYEAAFKAIRARFPELRESAINLAIELGVNALEQARG